MERFAGRVRKTQDDGSSSEVYSSYAIRNAKNTLSSGHNLQSEVAHVALATDRPEDTFFSPSSPKRCYLKRGMTSGIEKGEEANFGNALNEKLIKEPQDQLFFSRRARPISNFTPYTLEQYRQAKPEKYYELGKLQPDLHRFDLVAKRQNLNRVKEFSNHLRNVNRKIHKANPPQPKQITPRKESKREKAHSFAKLIPKPKKAHTKNNPPPKARNLNSPSLLHQNISSYDISDCTTPFANASRPHSHNTNSKTNTSTSRIQSASPQSTLEHLEAKHEHLRALTENIRRKTAAW